jgi:hypothetical protein
MAIFSTAYSFQAWEFQGVLRPFSGKQAQNRTMGKPAKGHQVRISAGGEKGWCSFRSAS